MQFVKKKKSREIISDDSSSDSSSDNTQQKAESSTNNGESPPTELVAHQVACKQPSVFKGKQTLKIRVSKFMQT